MATKTYDCLTITIRKLEESDPDSLSPESDRAAGEPPTSQPAPRADRPARDLLTDLAELLLQSLCDIKWEVRDTAVVTLGNIIHHAQGKHSCVFFLTPFVLSQVRGHVFSQLSSMPLTLRGSSMLPFGNYVS